MRFVPRAIAPMAAAIVALALSTAAHADYIWATVENGQVRFALMEYAGGTPNPSYASYVAGISPASDGKALAAGTPKEGAYYAAMPKGKNVVTAEKIVGVRERNGETYLLVYTAKGATSLAAAKTMTKAPAEVTARRDGDNLVVSVFQNGKPVAASEVWVQWTDDTDPVSVKTNDKGEVATPWSKAASDKGGFISIRAKVNETKSGELEGKTYPLIRRWATLAFPLAVPKAK
jgi:hypothetical protein